MNIYFVYDKTDIDNYGCVYPPFDYVELYATRELAQLEADRQNEQKRKWFERNEDQQIANLERENAKEVALEKAGFGQARLRKTERREFNPPYVVGEAEVQE